MKKIIIPFLLIAVLITACSKDEDPTEQLTPGPDVTTYGITANNELISFNGKTPSSNLNKISITGIMDGEKLLSIDFRPATGELYALSSGSKLYIINQNDGKARLVSATAFTPNIASGAVASIDFNPTVDRIRLVTNSGINLRLHPETGAVAATDGSINGISNPSISGIAYTNNKAGASTTTLYDIDVTTASLYKQDPPNNGTLVLVGKLNVTPIGQIAFDISSSGVGVAIMNKTFYEINLNTGAASKIGVVSDVIIDLAIPTDPVSYAVDMNNGLMIFNHTKISEGITIKPITGIAVGENILGIDFRPANGQLYAVSSLNKLYTINLSNGAATAIGTTGLVGVDLGSEVGFDFNPTVDRIRLVSNLGLNLRLHPETGIIAAVDGALNPGTPTVASAAYTNNFAGTTATQLFVIDHTTDKLFMQNPPNNGVLVEVGNLGLDINSNNGFDIGSRSNQAWLLASVGNNSALYSVNTTTGAVGNPIAFPSQAKSFAIGLGF